MKPSPSNPNPNLSPNLPLPLPLPPTPRYPELIAPPLTPELALRIFVEVQPEAVLADHPADYAYVADFSEWWP
jgi:hypothetical protein